MLGKVDSTFFIPDKITYFKLKRKSKIYQGIRVQYSRIFGPYIGGVILSQDLDTLIDLAIVSFLRNTLFNLPFGSAIGYINAPITEEKIELINQYIQYVRSNLGIDILLPDEGTMDLADVFYAELSKLDEKYSTNILFYDNLSYAIGIITLIKFALKGNFNVKIGIFGNNPANNELFKLLESLGSEVNYANLSSETDVLVITSGKKIINTFNENIIRAKILVEGSDLAITYDAYNRLKKRGIIVIPDILSNVGKILGVYLNWVNFKIGKIKFNEDEVIRFIYERINKVLRDVIEENKKYNDLKMSCVSLALTKISNTYKRTYGNL